MSEYIVKCTEVIGISGNPIKVPDYIDLNSEIVRCRDCKFCHKNYCEKRTSPVISPSEIFWIPVEPDGFCAWGEREEQ